MDLGKIPLLSMLTQRMAWLGQRQQTLAQNVANADTPGYKPRDIAPLDFLGLARNAARRVRLAATDARHLAGGVAAPAFREERPNPTFETGPASNAVVLEDELVKVSETVMEHQLMADLYRKHVKMIRTALGRGGG